MQFISKLVSQNAKVVKKLIWVFAVEYFAPPVDREGVVVVNRNLRMLCQLLKLEKLLNGLVKRLEHAESYLGDSSSRNFKVFVTFNEENMLNESLRGQELIWV